jgi:ectoine hydroxylase-related dioxygenase (phytanoyl-CoA dioxygenase family)
MNEGGARARVQHVQPPGEILEEMLAVRSRLDACGSDNGALRVIPGSHRHGRLTSEAIQDWIAGGDAVTCGLPAGGALLMRPLLLHASSEATSPAHRRVLHVELAANPLPGGLEWDV